VAEPVRYFRSGLAKCRLPAGASIFAREREEFAASLLKRMLERPSKKTDISACVGIS
jgi:hypothetical protein